MLQLLPMITGLLQNKQKQAEQAKQDEISAYMGQTPQAQAQGDSKSGLLNGAMGLLQGIGGEDKGPATDLGSPRYNDTAPAMGGGGLSKGTTSYLDDTFGAPHSEPDGDEYL
jgi:hypothetical protein